MIFFTADTHFGHANIIRHCDRPWDTIQQHDRDMIANWNAVVQPEDTVFHLGDFAYRCRKHYAAGIYEQLNGRVFVVPGGHDQRYLACYSLAQPLDVMRPSIYADLDVPIILCHYPLLTWWNVRRGSIHLHGHCHGRQPQEGRRMDVGVDAWGYTPVRLSTVMECLT